MTKTLTKDQKKIIDSIKNGENVLITWWAWTWKSFLLQELKSKYLDSLPVTASTWIAAVNVWGSTLHSFAGLWLAQESAEIIAKRISTSRNQNAKDRIQSINYLAIDEISMVSKELFDKLDQIFKIIRKCDFPFWWVQMILFWDFLQLPPISRDRKEVEFIFESDAFKYANFNTYVLDKVFRQNDDIFISLLNNLRFWQLKENDLDLLYSRSNLVVDESDWILATKIVTHNNQADLINNAELQKIDSDEFSFKRRELWENYAINNLKKSCLAQEVLDLKIWAQVMMLRNTYQDEWIVNWSLWIVVDFDDDLFPIVEFNNWKTKTIDFDQWIFEEYNWEYWELIEKWKIEQIPLRLAYAITVHKSQWMTLDKIECDLSKIFVEWQAYVALSRVKTIEWLYLKNFNPSRVRINKKVVGFYENEF